MALNPTLRKMVADAKAKYAHPDTFIPSERFHALMARLNEIEEPAGEARDKAIHYALLEVGKIAPEGWREYYE